MRSSGVKAVLVLATGGCHTPRLLLFPFSLIYAIIRLRLDMSFAPVLHWSFAPVLHWSFARLVG